MGESLSPTVLNQRDSDRIRGYQELLDFYRGVHWQGREKWGEKHLTFNYAKVFIDKITSYLMSGMNFVVEAVEDSDEARERARRAEQVLHRINEENNLEQLDLETEIDCAILGDAGYKVIWDTDAKRIRVTAPDVQGIYAWLSCPNGVWRAKLTEEKLDLSADLCLLRQEIAPTGGSLTIELRNDDGRYASPGEGSLGALDIGAQLDFSPGYRTTAGSEVSSGQSFLLGAYEHTSAGGKASLVLYATDGWGLVEGWRARHQFRWNKSSDQMSVKQLLEFVLARAGLKLEVVSQSSVVTGFYPDFTINAGNQGEVVISKLLSFVPDRIFIEGSKAYLVNPLSSDSSVYSYGSTHPVLAGEYRRGAWLLNRVQVEGYDTQASQAIIVDSFAWDEIERLYDRLRQVEDRNIDTVTKAEQRGEAYLRGVEIESASGAMVIPVNCGQQLYDVIDVTDTRAGLEAAKKRVLGLVLRHHPPRGEYEQRLSLGAV